MQISEIQKRLQKTLLQFPSQSSRCMHISNSQESKFTKAKKKKLYVYIAIYGIGKGRLDMFVERVFRMSHIRFCSESGATIAAPRLGNKNSIGLKKSTPTCHQDSFTFPILKGISYSRAETIVDFHFHGSKKISRTLLKPQKAVTLSL